MAKSIKIKTRLKEPKKNIEKEPVKKVESVAEPQSPTKKKELKTAPKDRKRPKKRSYAPYSRMFKLRTIDIDRQNKVVSRIEKIFGGRRFSATESMRGAMYLADLMANNKLLNIIWESQRPVQVSIDKKATGPISKSYSFFNSDIDHLKKITERLNSNNIDGRKITVTTLLQGLILLADKTSPKKLIESCYEIQKRHLTNRL